MNAKNKSPIKGLKSALSLSKTAGVIRGIPDSCFYRLKCSIL
jgi:hypothetical protein